MYACNLKLTAESLLMSCAIHTHAHAQDRLYRNFEEYVNIYEQQEYVNEYNRKFV